MPKIETNVFLACSVPNHAHPPRGATVAAARALSDRLRSPASTRDNDTDSPEIADSTESATAWAEGFSELDPTCVAQLD